MFYDMIIIDYYPEQDVGAVVVGLGQVYYELGWDMPDSLMID